MTIGLNAAVLSLSKIQFKSNSQRIRIRRRKIRSCAQSIKDTIQKQFTTLYCKLTNSKRLCSVYQRYNSKAIHNQELIIILYVAAVLSLSKIQFKSNSQLRVTSPNKANSCAQSIKDTIQKQFTTDNKLFTVSDKLCSVYQRYNSKAIHNHLHLISV